MLWKMRKEKWKIENDGRVQRRVVRTLYVAKFTRNSHAPHEITITSPPALLGFDKSYLCRQNNQNIEKYSQKPTLVRAMSVVQSVIENLLLEVGWDGGGCGSRVRERDAGPFTGLYRFWGFFRSRFDLSFDPLDLLRTGHK
jgi:hypothetical protein